MNKHLLVSNKIAYPVGSYIMDNLHTIKSMADAIYLVVNEYYYDCEKIELVCKGSSGAIIAGIVCNILTEKYNKTVNIYHIKKEGENSHSGSSFPSSYRKGIVVVIDDFISSGSTILSIVEKLHEYGISDIEILCVSDNIPNTFDDEFTHGICTYL